MSTHEERQEVLQALYEKSGHLTTTIVLDEAKKKRSPLHETFEWDDSLAAHQYRLDQARHLIRSVSITFEGKEQTLINVPSIKIEDGREGFYQVPSVIVKSETHFAHAMSKLKALVAGVGEGIDELLAAKKGSKKHLKEARKFIAATTKSLESAHVVR